MLGSFFFAMLGSEVRVLDQGLEVELMAENSRSLAPIIILASRKSSFGCEI